MRPLSAFVTSDRIAFTADANRMFFRLDAWAIAARVNLRELRPQEADQRRVINPEQQDDERTGRSKRTGGRSFSEVNTDSVFSSGKEQRRHRRSNPYVSPRDQDVRQKFVDRGKKNRDHEERGDNVCCLPNPRDAGQPFVHVVLKPTDDRAEYE